MPRARPRLASGKISTCSLCQTLRSGFLDNLISKTKLTSKDSGSRSTLSLASSPNFKPPWAPQIVFLHQKVNSGRLNCLSFSGAVIQIGCPPSWLVFHNSHTGGREDLGGHWGRLGGRHTDTDDLSSYNSSPFLLYLLLLTALICDNVEAQWQFHGLMWQLNDVAIANASQG